MYQTKLLGIKGKFCRKFGNREATSKKAKGKDKHVFSKCIVAFMLKALAACTNFTVACIAQLLPLSQGWTNIPQNHSGNVQVSGFTDDNTYQEVVAEGTRGLTRLTLYHEFGILR